jgi:uncharacterized membrane-anchored protein YitT (DUF2179 family)
MKNTLSLLWGRSAKNLYLVVLGTVVLAFGTSLFMIPFNLVAGGVTGIAIALGGIISSEIISVQLLITVMTWALFFIGFLVLGKRFALKTLVSTVVYPAAVSLFSMLVSPDVLGGYFDLATGAHGDIALLIAALAGGTLVGLGCAITFLGGGSTGGLDVIAFVICKYLPRLKSSHMMFLLDATVVVFGVFAIKDIVVSLLSIMTAFVVALVIYRVCLGGERGLFAEIVTEKSEELTGRIINDLHRTTTIVPAKGGYSGKQLSVVKVYLKMSEYTALYDLVRKTDKRAFITVAKAYEIRGEGWVD